MFLSALRLAKITISELLSVKLRTFNLIFLNFYRSEANATLIRRMASMIFSSLVA